MVYIYYKKYVIQVKKLILPKSNLKKYAAEINLTIVYYLKEIGKISSYLSSKLLPTCEMIDFNLTGTRHYQSRHTIL